MKCRLDELLLRRSLALSLTEANALIMSGVVFVEGQRHDKPGTPVPQDCQVHIKERDCPFVSRGGLKLQKALDEFAVSAEGKVCLDVGASTGGFTDCLLQRGARLVYSLDVGKGQLDWKLQNNDRVVRLEGINARNIERGLFDPAPELVTVDVSFISLQKILPALARLECRDIVVLVKPQFEARKGEVSRGGIISDPVLREEILRRFFDFASANRWQILSSTPSPIKGQKGNLEQLVWLSPVP